ncbi:hypothetical protein FB45DRAFT_1021221 [Roridomyces roridus]|uniref:Uncharacterized protein n=1 Tax=Roridomyces roridus TaxID=1738132 RepID=A0AAD7CBJ0_9AGAR|nr:hypothetical protein FB45DRAFT_1021221 [Roridomyces roridus]
MCASAPFPLPRLVSIAQLYDCHPRRPLLDSLQFPLMQTNTDTSIYSFSTSLARYLSPPPRLANADWSSIKTSVTLRARWMGSASTERLGNLTAVALASSLRPCLVDFTLFSANSISSLPPPT